MRFYRKHGAWIVESKTIVSCAGLLSIGRYGAEKAKAVALFPFVFVRGEEFATPIVINHERIHFRQQLELLFLGGLILHIIEDLYSRLFLKLGSPHYYFFRATEQEAYRNQHDFEYLRRRPSFNTFSYIKDKRALSFIPDKAPEVIVEEKI